MGSLRATYPLPHASQCGCGISVLNLCLQLVQNHSTSRKVIVI
jgi:hypothetical protein